MIKTFIVDETDVNMRIDRLLRSKLGKIPQSLIEKSLRNGKIRLNKKIYIFEKLSADELIKEIQEMPPGYRVVFNMFAIEGFSHQEIAEHLGVAESTSKSQYLRARAYLKERILKIDER